MKYSSSPHITALLGILLVVLPSFGQDHPRQGRVQNSDGVQGQAAPTSDDAPSTVTGPAVLENHGAVVRLPTAAHQPREGSKVLVDITRGAAPDQLNPALEKVAKYVNLYAAGGEEPATAHFVVVLHGDATRSILLPSAYAEEFGTQGNPNAKLLNLLHQAGVEIFVCGQTLHAHNRSREDTLEFVEIAVSALTACVNLQQDGYAYIPLGN